jgi:alpha-L-fucosidase
MKRISALLLTLLCITYARSQDPKNYLNESREQYEVRMDWWSQARFGMFIHWGLYSIPAGEWKGSTNHAEWIRTTAQIPLSEYDKFVGQFNPVKFNANDWVRMAKSAGMKYITITSKHHDGFCLFDSKHTEFDIMSTPFKRDILKELADACHKEGIKICFYHSIMDWHHPDYLPRREWEKDRPASGSDYGRYVQHLKNQLKELLTNYGEISVLWFDGEWESTWNQKYGTEIYNFVRSLQPNIIINNRVGAGRSGMEGFTNAGEFAGDFGTPEQEIPPTGMPGLYWETCMTMNDNWGYNKHDDHWKSAEDLIRKLADIASKGGNFLLNVGPTAEGVFPQSSINRLREIGEWMKVNGEAIYSTKASPFKSLNWGRCTQKPMNGGVRLFLHVFDWPADGKLIVPGMLNTPKQAYLLSDAKRTALAVGRNEDALVISVPAKAPDATNSVVVVDVDGKLDITSPPSIGATSDIFIDALRVSVTSDRENVDLRFTLDGTRPDASSALVSGPITLTNSGTVTARCFRDGKPVSEPAAATFTKVKPAPGTSVDGIVNGIHYEYFEGDWNILPDFANLKAVKSGTVGDFDLSPRLQPEYFGLEYSCYIRMPEDGVYSFFLASDDGSRLFVNNKLLVDNDGLHAMLEKKGVVALSAGLHAMTVQYFQKGGGRDIKVSIGGPTGSKQSIPGSMLFMKK